MQGLDDGVGEHGDAVVVALAVADDDLMVVEVYILDAQAHGFHDAQTTAVHDLGDEFLHAGQVIYHSFDFVFGEDGGDGSSTLRAEFVEGGFVNVNVKNVAIEKEEGAENLILGGGGNFPMG